jgi:D-sedoheptulose 7-phosphate isomerase
VKAFVTAEEGFVNKFLMYATDLKHTIDQLPYELIESLVDCLHHARLNGNSVFIMGNGGSATTATHLACDLDKNTVVPNVPRFRVISLTDNMAFFSALANDIGYENVFAEQLLNFVKAGDVVIAISASGNSANVLKAVTLAKENQAFTVGWSGYGGGKLARLVDLPIVAPNHCIEQIEDVHLILAHMVTQAVRHAAEQRPAPSSTEDRALVPELKAHALVSSLAV